MNTHLRPIVFAKMHVGGLLVRPDSRSVMRKAADGHPVDVSSSYAYINLYHVFERMQAGESRLRKLQLVRRQIGHNRWRLFIVADESEIPPVTFEEGYDPKRGRYKRFAQQLAAGELLKLPSKTEALKARRAWQLYVRPDDRRHLKSTVRKSGNPGYYAVEIVDRN